MAGKTKTETKVSEEIVESATQVETTTDVKLKEENDLLKDQLAKMNEMLVQLQNKVLSQDTPPQAPQPTYSEDEKIALGCAMFGTNGIRDAIGTTRVKFDGFGSVKFVDKDTLKAINIPQNDKLFSKGLIYFVDDSMYDKEKMPRPNTSIDKDSLIELLSKNNVELTEGLDKITSKRIDKNMCAIVLSLISLLIVKGKVQSTPMLSNFLSAYFEINFDSSLQMTMWAENVGISKNSI